MADWPSEIDGRAVLRRILDDGGRVRLSKINDSMAEAAQQAIAGLLPVVDAAGQETLLRLNLHLTKVLRARRKARTRA